jgi:hypothetical protein
MKKAGISDEGPGEMTVSTNTLMDEVEDLKKEMESFKTGNPGRKRPTG